MSLLDHFWKRHTSSLNALSEQKKMFLVNYLGDRRFEWGIHDSVKEKYPDLEKNIKDLEKDGLIQICESEYRLTSRGLDMRKLFRSQERARHESMINDVMRFAEKEDFLAAYNARSNYEKNSVVPHGIFIGESADSHWKTQSKVPESVGRYIENSHKLDFSDCNNSDSFKLALRNFYVGLSVSGSNRIELPLDFEERLGEFLDCPALDKQLEEKCEFPNPPKLRIYFNTKVSVFNLTETKVIKSWDGNFFLGVFDCTDRFHAAMAQYEKVAMIGIDKFPKTFKTFYKHKLENSEKYQEWIRQYDILSKK